MTSPGVGKKNSGAYLQWHVTPAVRLASYVHRLFMPASTLWGRRTTATISTRREEVAGIGDTLDTRRQPHMVVVGCGS